MTATEVELRKENADLRDEVTRLRADLATMTEHGTHIRNAFLAALDQHVLDENTRHRVLITASAELLMTAVAMPYTGPSPRTGQEGK